MITKTQTRLTTEEKQELATQYATLVKPIARRIGNNLPAHLTFEDLLQEGILGLMEALERFDPSQGYELRTFAAQRIKGAILDRLRRDDFTGRGVRRRARELYVAKDRLYQRLGRTPGRGELADEAGITLDELHRREGELSQARVGSLQQPLRCAQDSEVTLLDTLSDDRRDTASQAETALRLQALAKALLTLPERERHLLSLYYNEGLNIREVALVFGVSEARISQLHKRALARLGQVMKADPLASQTVSGRVAV